MNPKTSTDLFNKIRSQFSNIRIGDENGAATADPGMATFFEFEFKEDSDTFGSVSISIAEDGIMKVFYNRNLVDKIDEDSKDEWYAFLKELKDFAIEHQLRFDVRDITKTALSKQDYQNLADTNKTVNTDEMSEELNRITKLAGVEVKEGLTGTAKRSYENLDKTRLIIRHSGKVDETVPGARSRRIESLYIENEDGERFKYPLTHLAGARAMMRHVANGGRPHDEFGQHIVSTSEDIAKLNSFSRYVSHKDQLNDTAGDIIEKTKLKLENLREYVKNLAKQSHYEAASKDFKTGDDIVVDDETINALKDKFTLRNLDNRVEDALPLIHKVMQEIEASKEKEEQVNELDDATPEPLTPDERISPKIKSQGMRDFLDVIIDKWEPNVHDQMEDSFAILHKYNSMTGNKLSDEQMDKLTDLMGKGPNYDDVEFEKDLTKAGVDLEKLGQVAKQYKDDPYESEEGEKINELDPGEEPIDAPVEPPVDHGAIVTSFLTDPKSKLVLRKDDTADKMLSVTKFKDKNTMLGSILSDIASRMLTKTGEEDRVANFASRIADNLEQEGTTMFKPDADYAKNKKIAIQLAKRYIDDYKKIKNDPEYAKEVRMDPEEYNPKKHPKLDKRARGEAAEFVEWADEVTNEYARDNYESWLAKRGVDVNDLSADEHYKLSQQFKMDQKKQIADLHAKKKPGEPIKYTPSTATEPARFEDLTFEDIKPYVSMYKGDDGKTVYDVLDKNSQSAFKTDNAKAAMEYLKQNFNILSKEITKESLNEERSKIVAAIKAKADNDNAQNIAGVEEEISRITQLATY